MLYLQFLSPIRIFLVTEKVLRLRLYVYYIHFNFSDLKFFDSSLFLLIINTNKKSCKGLFEKHTYLKIYQRGSNQKNTTNNNLNLMS